MRVLHTGDIHLTEGPRFDVTLGCLDRVVETGTRERVDLWTIGGDLSGTTVPHAMTTREELALAVRFQAMAEVAPVIIAEGNHESPRDLEIFGRLEANHMIAVVTRPEVVRIDEAEVYCLPYPSKRWFVGAGAAGAIADQKQAAEGSLRALLEAWRLAERLPAVWRIGLGHLNVGGSILGGGEVMIGREIELSPHDLVELGMDVGLLSHIHRHQEPAPGWFYAGNLNAQNHGEGADKKVFLLVDLVPGQPICVRPIPSGARRLVTVNVQWAPAAQRFECAGQPVEPRDLEIEDADVRVRVTVPEDAAAAAPMALLESVMAEAGAHAVSVEPTVIPRQRQRDIVAGEGAPDSAGLSAAFARAESLEAKLGLYWQSLGDAAPPPEQQARALAKLQDLAVVAAASVEAEAAA